MAQPAPTCDFKSGQVILQQPIARKQMSRLLETGKTDLLDKFVSMRTRRGFKAMLAWDAEAGKVNFEFAPRIFAPRKTAAASASKPVATTLVTYYAIPTRGTDTKAPPNKVATAKTAAKTAVKTVKPAAPRKAPARPLAKAPRAATAGTGLQPVQRCATGAWVWLAGYPKRRSATGTGAPASFTRPSSSRALTPRANLAQTAPRFVTGGPHAARQRAGR